MTDLMHARVIDHLTRLRLGHVAERIDSMLSDAAKRNVTFLELLDGLLSDEVASKHRKRIAGQFLLTLHWTAAFASCRSGARHLWPARLRS